MKYILLIITIVTPKILLGQIDLGEEYSFKNNEILLSAYSNFQFKRYSFEGPFFNITIIPNDPYNKDKPNASMIGPITLTPFLISSILFHGVRDSTSHNKLRKHMKITAFFISIFNSQHHLKLLKHKSQSGFFDNLTLFISSRSDWFIYQNITWWRYRYGMGIQFHLFDPRKYRKTTFLHSKAFFLQLGIEKPYDYVEKDWNKISTKYYFSFKFLLIGF